MLHRVSEPHMVRLSHRIAASTVWQSCMMPASIPRRAGQVQRALIVQPGANRHRTIRARHGDRRRQSERVSGWRTT